MKTSKIKEQNAKKTVYLIKAISVLWGRGGETHRKKNLEKQNNFFLLISKILKILFRGGGGGVA